MTPHQAAMKYAELAQKQECSARELSECQVKHERLTDECKRYANILLNQVRSQEVPRLFETVHGMVLVQATSVCIVQKETEESQS